MFAGDDEAASRSYTPAHSTQAPTAVLLASLSNGPATAYSPNSFPNPFPVEDEEGERTEDDEVKAEMISSEVLAARSNEDKVKAG